jgi:hypothetical protein
LALIHRREVRKLLEDQEALVRQMQTELEAVAKPVVPAKPTEAVEGAENNDDDEETADEKEPLILHVLNED